MLKTLDHHHAALLALMDEMRGLLGQAPPAAATLAATRLAMSRASAARTRHLVETVYPALLDTVGPTEAEPVRRLRDDAAADRARSSAHVGRWTGAAIAADWPGFRTAAHAILAMMAARIDRERTILRPLLER